LKRNGIVISAEDCEVLAVDVSCTDDMLGVLLEDGRTVAVPLVWFPRLLNATPKQRAKWEFLGGGMGIHWESVDEDISIASLLHPERFPLVARVVPRKSPQAGHPGHRRARRKVRA